MGPPNDSQVGSSNSLIIINIYMISDTQTTIYIVCMGWLQTNKHFAGAPRCLWFSQCLRSNPGTQVEQLLLSGRRVTGVQLRGGGTVSAEEAPGRWWRWWLVPVREGVQLVNISPISLGSLVVTGCHQFFMFPEILGFDYHPNWRSHIFQRGGEKPPTSRVYRWYIYL